eukprot:518268-Pleurochrysis_carterae.AAC.1
MSSGGRCTQAGESNRGSYGSKSGFASKCADLASLSADERATGRPGDFEPECERQSVSVSV